MGAQVAQISPTPLPSTDLVLASSDVATKSDESHESDEGSERCKGWKGHDSNSRVPVRCRNHWFKASIQDGEGTSDEKAQRDGELMMHDLRGPCLESNLELFVVMVGGLARPRCWLVLLVSFT